ncbi:MAG TPA: ABC transporter substrate-binding protein [Clostridia bacterium]|nr:ABC transporter substrate-binding protein [Clostridia bacterium]
MSRSFMSKKVSLLLCIALILTFLAGCSGSNPGSATTAPTVAPDTAAPSETAVPEEPVELVVGLSGESLGLDPQQMPGFGFDVNMLYEPLIVPNADNTAYVPALCESMSYSDDGKTITFTLPEGLVFPNGDPLDAAAVKASFERLLQIAPLKFLYMIIQGVDAPDAKTVVLRCMTQPSAMMSVIASPLSAIMNAAVASSLGDAAFMTAPVGYGPYTVAEWNRGNYMLLQANENFKTNNPLVDNHGAFYFDTIRIRTIPSAFTRVSELEAGNVDLIFDIPTDSVESLMANPDVTVVENRTTAMFYAAINSNRIPDLAVRTALNLATDRDQIVQALSGAAIATYGPLLPQWVGGSQAVEDKFKSAFSYDPEGAKALLAEVGYADSDGDGMLDKDGAPFSLTMCIVSGQADVETAATIMQAQFKAVGIDLIIKAIDGAMAAETAQTGDYDLLVWSCGWSDANIFTFTFTQEPTQMMANSPDYQQLVALCAEADFNNDILVRQQKYAAAADLVYSFVPMISLYNPTAYMAYRNAVTGIKIVNGVIYLNDATKAN